jgi:hypothetical protein
MLKPPCRAFGSAALNTRIAAMLRGAGAKK